MTRVWRAGFLVLVLLAPMLLAKGSAPHCRQWNTYNYFLWASAENVKNCLDEGAKVNIRDHNGRMPLHFAAWATKDPKVIKILLDAGAEPLVRDGVTPLHYGGANKLPEVLDILIEAIKSSPQANEIKKNPPKIRN